MASTEPTRREGIIVPLVTPITAGGALDEPALRRLVDRVIDGGVHGIFALGTTGEMPSLERAMRHEVVRIIAEANAGRVPLYAGVTDPSFGETVANAERYRALGADYFVALVPYYYPLTEAEILAYFLRLAEATGGPLLIYDFPAMTKMATSHAVLDQLSQDGRFAGYKDSSGNALGLWQLLGRLEGREGFSIFVGPEALLADAVLWGAAGGVSGGANVWPELLVSIYEAARARDLAALDTLRNQLRARHRIFQVGDGGSPVIAGLKGALESLGVCERHLLPPLKTLDDAQAAEVRRIVSSLGAQEL